MIAESLATSGKTSEAGYYTPEEIMEMDYMMPLYERITDAFVRREQAFVR